MSFESPQESYEPQEENYSMNGYRRQYIFPGPWKSPFFVQMNVPSLDEAAQSGIEISGYSPDGKRKVGSSSDLEKVLAHYDRFKAGPVAAKFQEMYGKTPYYDAILVGKINNAKAYGANIITGDGRQYLMIDERYVNEMDERMFDQIYSHEWHHGIGVHDEVQTSSMNQQLYNSLADQSSGYLRQAYEANAREESMRANYQERKGGYAA